MQAEKASYNAMALHNVIRLRQRYILNKNNKIRLRYMASSTFVLALAIGVSTSSIGARFSENMQNVISSAPAHLAQMAPEGGFEEAGLSDILQSGVSNGIRKASLAMKKADKAEQKEVEVGRGDTVAGLLQNAGLSGSETYEAVQALGKLYDVRKIRSGQKINLQFRPGEDGQMRFSKMQLKLDPIKQVSVTRSTDGFEAELMEKELVSKTHAKFVKIETSLYGSAARANIPRSVIAELIRIYSWNVDFQRDIQPGDKIEVLYDSNETEDGDYAKLGTIRYASLTVGGRPLPLYRYETEEGREDYFSPEGRSTRSVLMRTPIDGARISSGFGMRRHPVLGYSKMHKGTDFAAPTGTPIYAAGDGTLEYAGRFSSFGNYIRIRHNSTLKTAYAHMQRLASGMSVGSRVKQGQIIGYVGTTGRSTGPHLHYEVHVNGKQTNPNSVKLPTGEQLKDNELKRFKSMISKVKQQYVSLAQSMKYAQNAHEDMPDKTHIR